MKLAVIFKGKPMTMEQARLINSAYAAAEKDRFTDELNAQCKALGIDCIYWPPLAVIDTNPL